MGLSRTVSEIDGDFSGKSQNFPTVYFARPLKGLPLEMGTGAGKQKTRMMGLPVRQKKFDDIFSRVDTMHQYDSQRQTPGDSKNHAYA